jgi:hypothetical protein
VLSKEQLKEVGNMIVGFSLSIPVSSTNKTDRNTIPEIEMPVKNQLQGMLAVFESLDRAQSKKNFEPSFVKI